MGLGLGINLIVARCLLLGPPGRFVLFFIRSSYLFWASFKVSVRVRVRIRDRVRVKFVESRGRKGAAIVNEDLCPTIHKTSW